MVTIRGAGLVGGVPPEPVVLPPGRWCERCGRPEVLDGGWLCRDCAWMASEREERR